MRQTIKPVGTVDGAPLGYVEYLPPDYDLGERLPLLLFHHASDQSGDGGDEALGKLSNAGPLQLIAEDKWPEDRPFIVLAPQHERTPTENCTTASEVDSFLDFAVAEYNVDPARVYLTGTSCGAFGAWDYLGLHTDEVVAAAVLIAGDGRPAFDEAGCELGRVAIWAFHGQFDPIVQPNGSLDPINALNDCTDPDPVDARVMTIPGSHAIWNPIYAGEVEDIYSWMLSHQKPL